MRPKLVTYQSCPGGDDSATALAGVACLAAEVAAASGEDGGAVVVAAAATTPAAILTESDPDDGEGEVEGIEMTAMVRNDGHNSEWLLCCVARGLD